MWSRPSPLASGRRSRGLHECDGYDCGSAGDGGLLVVVVVVVVGDDE